MTYLDKIMGYNIPHLSPDSGETGIFGGGSHGDLSNTIDFICINSTGNAFNFGDITTSRSLLAATSNGANDRGVFASGSSTNIIDYITISTPGDATNFGDLSTSSFTWGGCSNNTNERGVFGGGNSQNLIDYITINSAGDATDFGDLTNSRTYTAGLSNSTNERGVFGGGELVGDVQVNTIDYITINSTGNATNFGDLTDVSSLPAATSNLTNERGVFGGGDNGVAPKINVIAYITINSTGDATNFGDLTEIKYGVAATSNGTSERGAFGGGNTATGATNTIEYITINSAGDATDFGDLTEARRYSAATSDA